MNCKPGDLAVVVRTGRAYRHFLGRVVTVKRACRVFPESWDCDPPFIVDGLEASVRDSGLRPIRDQPGNEQFVVEARKSLPRPATAKGDTIDVRGEVHS